MFVCSSNTEPTSPCRVHLKKLVSISEYYYKHILVSDRLEKGEVGCVVTALANVLGYTLCPTKVLCDVMRVVERVFERAEQQ